MANEPVLRYAIEDLREAAITEIAVVLGNTGRESIQEALGDGSAFGIADVDDDGRLTRLVETPEDPPCDLALIGIYVFSSRVFEVTERLEFSWRGEFEIAHAIQALSDEGHAIDSQVIEGWWKDTGKPRDILEANRLVLEEKPGERRGTVEDGAETVGHVELRAGATIESGAVVHGPVSIGEDATIREGTYLGPSTSIGPDSVISDVHVENSVLVGENSQVTL